MRVTPTMCHTNGLSVQKLRLGQGGPPHPPCSLSPGFRGSRSALGAGHRDVHKAIRAVELQPEGEARQLGPQGATRGGGPPAGIPGRVWVRVAGGLGGCGWAVRRPVAPWPPSTGSPRRGFRGASFLERASCSRSTSIACHTCSGRRAAAPVHTSLGQEPWSGTGRGGLPIRPPRSCLPGPVPAVVEGGGWIWILTLCAIFCDISTEGSPLRVSPGMVPPLQGKLASRPHKQTSNFHPGAPLGKRLRRKPVSPRKLSGSPVPAHLSRDSSRRGRGKAPTSHRGCPVWGCP